jgi:putative endonuclease
MTRAEPARMPSPSQRWGAAHEEVAEQKLLEQGYTIVERNWRGGGGELDRIAWNAGVLCFVEVRARSSASFGMPAETVDHRKRRKVIRAAASYLMRFSPGTKPLARFDVVSIVNSGRGPPDIVLIKNAFDASR